MLIRFFEIILFLSLYIGNIGCILVRGNVVSTLASPTLDLPVLYKNYCECIVKVSCVLDGKQCQTSGFFVSDTGHVLTSVVNGKDFSVQKANGQWLSAEKIGDDLTSSICLLKVDCGKEVVQFFPLMRDYDWPAIGQSLVSLSCKLGFNVSPQLGYVTSFCDHYYGVQWPMPLVRSNLPIDAGDCGGAVLDAQGNLQGMLLHALDASKETFFMPLCGLRKIFQDLLVFGRVRYCYIGLNTQAVFDNVRRVPCLKVLEVVPLSPADKACFKEGDILVKINQTPINSVESFKNFMFLSMPNDVCELEILRKDKIMKLTLTLGEKMQI